jgi:paraquat-inducible protein A
MRELAPAAPTEALAEARAAAATDATLVACPYCDALNRAADPPPGGRIRCGRCGEVLMTNRPGALDRTLATAFASVILMTAAVLFPFLELHTFGLRRDASVLDAALAFSSGLMAPLAIAVGMLIIVIPTIRAVALAYVILPLRLGRRPAPGAADALRLAGVLKPWAMAEIFIIGVVVALVKVAGMASVTLGPAFWAMAAIVVLVVIEGASLCEWSLWRTLDQSRRR